jgi:hypothetical protein
LGYNNKQQRKIKEQKNTLRRRRLIVHRTCRLFTVLYDCIFVVSTTALKKTYT